jgi:hypothetical protein
MLVERNETRGLLPLRIQLESGGVDASVSSLKYLSSRHNPAALGFDGCYALLLMVSTLSALPFMLFEPLHAMLICTSLCFSPHHLLIVRLMYGS